MVYRKFLDFLFSKNIKDFKSIPIIINNYNRLSTLKLLINSLEKRGYSNIYIIDNRSTFKPLLAYYKSTPYKVFRLKKNVGFRSLWKTNLWYRFMFNYHVYTDSDVLLVDDCPDKFLEYFYDLLQKYPDVFKVGCSLQINDLPDNYDKKSEVIHWEKQFYKKEKEQDIFVAPIDTTLALYRPFHRKGKCDGSDEMLRVNHPFQLKHLPWYMDSSNLSEEEKFYIKSITKPTHWSENNN